MEESRKPRYSEETIAFASRSVEWLNSLSSIILILLVYLIWTFSPNALTAIFLVCSTTVLPVSLTVFLFDAMCRVAISLRKKYPSLISDTSWEKLKSFGALLLVIEGKISHGFEVHGKENLPESTGALLIYHHGLMPLDVFYLIGEQILSGRTALHGIIDRGMKKSLRGVCEVFNFGSERDQVVESLKRGHPCAVAPGGGPEATFTRNYDLVWNGRKGFAEVAKQCGVPVIPMFTVNSEQAMPVSTFGLYDLFKEVSVRTKKVLYLPLICFPVKMRTYLGKPLFCGSDESPPQFAERVEVAIYELRDEHQRRPGSLILALLERFGYPEDINGSRDKEGCEKTE